MGQHETWGRLVVVAVAVGGGHSNSTCSLPLWRGIRSDQSPAAVLVWCKLTPQPPSMAGSSVPDTLLVWGSWQQYAGPREREGNTCRQTPHRQRSVNLCLQLRDPWTALGRLLHHGPLNRLLTHPRRPALLQHLRLSACLPPLSARVFLLLLFLALQLAFDSEGIAITSVMGFVKNPVSSSSSSSRS